MISTDRVCSQCNGKISLGDFFAIIGFDGKDILCTICTTPILKAKRHNVILGTTMYSPTYLIPIDQEKVV